jgi:hypothetical protein
VIAMTEVRYTYLGGPIGASVPTLESTALASIGRAQSVGFQVQEHAVLDREGKPLTVVSEHGQAGVWCTYEFQGE